MRKNQSLQPRFQKSTSNGAGVASPVRNWNVVIALNQDGESNGRTIGGSKAHSPRVGAVRPIAHFGSSGLRRNRNARKSHRSSGAVGLIHNPLHHARELLSDLRLHLLS